MDRSKEQAASSHLGTGPSFDPDGLPSQPKTLGRGKGKTSSIRKEARVYGIQAIRVLAASMTDPDAKVGEKIQAATKILEQGYGKPFAQQPVKGEESPRLLIGEINDLMGSLHPVTDEPPDNPEE